jgi:hypothetical protein
LPQQRKCLATFRGPVRHWRIRWIGNDALSCPTGTFVPALLVGAVIALGSALAYLVVIPNRPIRSAELGVAAPSARPSGASM